MMRILCVLTENDYGFPERGVSFEYIIFYDVLKRMGYDVQLFDTLSLLALHGKQKMNQMLLEKVATFAPDLMFTYLMRDEIDSNILDTITRKTPTTTIGYFGDDEWRFDDFSGKYGPAFSWIVTTDQQAVSRYRQIGCQNVIYKASGTNPNIFNPKGDAAAFDCTFVGGARFDRIKLVNRLRNDGVRVDCWGTSWDMSFMDRVFNKLLRNPKRMLVKSSRTRLTFEEMSSVFERSRVNLNLSGAYRGTRGQIKCRVFDVTAAGGFLLCEYVPGLENFFELDKEIVCFATYDELLEKTRYYLGHEAERRSIAEAGRRRTLGEHTGEHRFREIFTEMGISEPV